MSDEDFPEPSDRLTGPERFLAERLTPYRVFWIKMFFNVLIIACFVWAGFLMMDYRAEAQEVHDAIKEEGCAGLPPEWEPDVSGQDPGIEENFSFDNVTAGQEVSPPG